MPYLSVHFRESLSPDGEQVYFGLSEDGYHWESVGGGRPVLRSTMGTGGCRDIEIVRKRDGGFGILTTDLCIVNKMDERHNVDWKDLNHNGSKFLCWWETDDLVHFSEQRLLYFGRDDFGCLWAPEIFYDENADEYLIHWGSTVRETDFEHMSIYACTTKDFRKFSKPFLYFDKPNEILDSHIVKFGDTYHLFYKNANDPSGNMHETSKSLYGPFAHDDEMDRVMRYYTNAGAYEGATTYVLPDGRWCLMLDFFGCPKEEMGYVPYVSPAPGDTRFKRADSEFFFPYGFKHGKFIEITEEEYRRVKTMYGE